VGHSVQPVADRFSRHDRTCLADEDEKRRLKCVLSIVVTTEQALTDAPDHRGVSPHQSGKGGIVPAIQEEGQQFSIGHLGPVTPEGRAKLLDDRAHRTSCHCVELRRSRVLHLIPRCGAVWSAILTNCSKKSNFPAYMPDRTLMPTTAAIGTFRKYRNRRRSSSVVTRWP
jgi:hypothetical protein